MPITKIPDKMYSGLSGVKIEQPKMAGSLIIPKKPSQIDMGNFKEILNADKMGLDDVDVEKTPRYRNVRRDYIVSVDEDYGNPQRTIITLINGDSLTIDLPEGEVMDAINKGAVIGCQQLN